MTEDVGVIAGKLSTSGALTIADTDTGQANFTARANVAGSNGYGSFTLAADGTWSYSADDSQAAIQQLGEGQSLTDSFTAVSSDGSASQLVTVTINGTNDEPVITSSIESGSPITERAGTGLATADTALGAVFFTDADLSDTHTVTVTGVAASGVTSGLPANSTLLGWLTLGAVTDSTNGATGGAAWTFSAQDQSFDYLAAGQSVTLTYTVQVADGHSGGTASQNVTVTINGTDDAPTVTGSSATVSEEGLPGGNPDNVGSPTDTTNSTTASGTISRVGRR